MRLGMAGVAIAAALFAAGPRAESADTVNQAIGTLPSGKTVVIRFNATVANPLPPGVGSVSNQGTVSGTNFSDVLTDDPAVGGAADPTVTIIQLPSTTTVSSDFPVSVFGQNVTFTATVSGAGPTPTGTVQFVIDGVSFGAPVTLVGGQAQASTSSLAVGTHSVSADYIATEQYAASSGFLPGGQVVTPASTTTTITGDTPDPSVTGQSVAVTYTVNVTSPGAGTPTGTVTVTDGVDSCIGTLPTLSCNITFTSAGPKLVTATYNGDGNFNASPPSVAEPHLVNKADTTTAITADPTDPSAVGQLAPFSYSVSVTAPGGGTPTGNVMVSDGVDSCTGSVAAGVCSIAFTSPGPKIVTATYLGDASYNASPPSVGEPHTVVQATTTTTITSDPTDPSVVGQPIVVGYSVTPSGAGTPTGNVTVTDGVDSCTGTVATGNCVLTLFTAGSRPLTATYEGDTNFAGSTSAPEPHTVAKANTTTVITDDPTDPSVVGQPVTISYSVSVDAPGSGTPTGNVTVTDGVDSCTGAVSAGSCVITFGSVGAKMLTATYEGDANYNASPASVAEPHTVNQASTTTTITSNTPNPSATGQAVTVNYAVAVVAPGSGTPTGNVTVTDGVDSCTGTVAAGMCDITFTTPGTRTLTATYEGDANYTASTSAGVSQMVANLGTCATPVIAVPDGRVTATAIPASSTAWFGATLQSERSYSLELSSTLGDVAPGTATIFSGDDGCSGASTVTVRDTTDVDPGAVPGAVRLSFTAASADPFFRARLDSGAGAAYTFSLSETTMFSPVWSTNGAFDTYYAIQNTTGATLNGTLTFRDVTGATVSTFSFTVPAGQKVNTTTAAVGVVRNAAGTATLVHDGPPGALLVEAAVANFALSTPYVQTVRFTSVREAR